MPFPCRPAGCIQFRTFGTSLNPLMPLTAYALTSPNWRVRLLKKLTSHVESSRSRWCWLLLHDRPVGIQTVLYIIHGRATLGLLDALSSSYQTRRKGSEGIRLVDDLAPLLQGTLPSQRPGPTNPRLSDTAIVKLFRLIRLARRLVELESDA